MAGPTKMFTIVQRRLTIQGFIVSDHIALMGEFVSEVGGLVKDGKLKSRETVVDGLAQRPRGFPGPAQGREFRQAGGEGRDLSPGGARPQRYFVRRSAAKRGSPWRSTNSRTERFLACCSLVTMSVTSCGVVTGFWSTSRMMSPACSCFSAAGLLAPPW